MLYWLYYLLLLAILAGSLFVNILVMPGLWFMVLAAIFYALLTHFDFVGWRTIVVSLALAAIAEGAELYVGAAHTKKAGGGRMAAIGAIVGGMLGGIFLSLIPIPILSTIVGVCAGSFLGAMAMHFIADRDGPGGVRIGTSLRVGAGAAAGRFLGIVVKLAFGIVMFVIIAWEALPIGGQPAPVPTTPAVLHAPIYLPATTSTSLPSTLPGD